MERKITSGTLHTIIATVCAIILCAVLAVFVLSVPRKTLAEEAVPGSVDSGVEPYLTGRAGGSRFETSSGDAYAVPDHVFGGEVEVDQPVFNGEGGDITMTLFLLDTEYSWTFGQADFYKYINSAMPAGEYSLQVTVADVAEEGSVTETFTFTVEKAELPGLEEFSDALKSKKFELDVETDGLYDDEFTSLIESYIDLSVDTSGTVWGDEANADLYGSYTITYCLARWQTDEFFPMESVVVSKPDTYTIYYKITAPNYYSNVDNGTRYSYYFNLVKYQVLEAPMVVSDGLFYTGNKVLPTVEESDLYRIVWDSVDEYVTGGEHRVSFKLRDNVHYRWYDVENDAPLDGDTYEVSFVIARAENEFTVSLNMLGWSFEAFDKDVNNVRVAAKFLDEGEKIHLRVTKKGEFAALDGLNDFSIDANGRVDKTVADILYTLPTGEYTLNAIVYSTVNYNKFERSVDFVVSKAHNSWANGDDDLVIPSWVEGEYSATENIMVVNSAHGTVNIIITDIDGKEYYNSITGVNNLSDCPVGKYLLKAWVNETDNFESLAERTFTIEVFAKPGLPWWTVLIIVIGALAVAALIIFILWKKEVFQILTDKLAVSIRTSANIDATIAAVRAAKMEAEDKKNIASEEAKERAEARRAAAKAEREKPAEEQAAAMEAKAKAQAERAEKMRLRAEAMQARADRLREKYAPKPEESEPTPSAETAAENPAEPVEAPQEATNEAPKDMPAEVQAEVKAEEKAEVTAKEPKAKTSSKAKTQSKPKAKANAQPQAEPQTEAAAEATAEEKSEAPTKAQAPKKQTTKKQTKKQGE